MRWALRQRIASALPFRKSMDAYSELHAVMRINSSSVLSVCFHHARLAVGPDVAGSVDVERVGNGPAAFVGGQPTRGGRASACAVRISGWDAATLDCGGG